MGVETGGMTPSEVKQAILTALGKLTEGAGIPSTLRDVGVDKSSIPLLAERAINDPCIFTNPRFLRCQDIEAIYEKAL